MSVRVLSRDPDWDPGRRAEELARRRAEFVRRLPGRIRIARKLSLDLRELVVDDAIEFTALRHDTPVPSAADLERVFWNAALKRAQQAADGRHDTVRAGFSRADPDALEQLHDPAAGDPARVVEAAVDAALTREFKAELDEPERLVVRAKYETDGEEAGYRAIANALGWSIGEVRKVEARIAYKANRFAAITAAGRLCAWRGPSIAALAAGDATEHQAAVARAHLAECRTCTIDYLRQLRYLRSPRFQREVAQLLPPVTVATERRTRTGVRDLLADWIARTLGPDAPTAALHATASGAGRGLGTAAALKLAALCTGGAVGACLATGVLPLPVHRDPPPARTAPTPRPTSTPSAREPRLPHGGVRPTPTPTPTPRPPRRKRHAAPRTTGAQQGASGPRGHEQRPASPAPANAAPNGASEFDPTFQPSAPAAPAPVPAAPGASEFG